MTQVGLVCGSSQFAGRATYLSTWCGGADFLEARYRKVWTPRARVAIRLLWCPRHFTPRCRTATASAPPDSTTWGMLPLAPWPSPVAVVSHPRQHVMARSRADLVRSCCGTNTVGPGHEWPAGEQLGRPLRCPAASTSLGRGDRGEKCKNYHCPLSTRLQRAPAALATRLTARRPQRRARRAKSRPLSRARHWQIAINAMDASRRATRKTAIVFVIHVGIQRSTVRLLTRQFLQPQVLMEWHKCPFPFNKTWQRQGFAFGESHVHALPEIRREPRARLAKPRARLAFFQEWRAARANQLNPSNAQSHEPRSWSSSDDVPPPPPPAPLPLPSPSSSSTPSTAGFSLASPPWPPLHAAAAGPALDAQVAELMSRDRDAAVALALTILRHLPMNELAAELTGAFGDVPSVLAGAGSHAEQSTHDSNGASSVGAASATSPPTRLAVPVSSDERLSNVTRTQRCYCCDEEVGDGTSECAALRLLDSLESELELRDQIVERELADGYDEEITHRGARWYMYRAFVAHKFGYLGRGVGACAYPGLCDRQCDRGHSVTLSCTGV